MAARRRRRQQLIASPPQLRWQRLIAAAHGSEQHIDGTPVWALQLTNDGGAASDVRIVLFSGDVVARDGGDETIATGQRWDFTLGELEARPGESIWGYALAQGGDGQWFARTVDGRGATFRSMPDELGVCRTLGLRMPVTAARYEGTIRTEHAPAGHAD